MVSSEKDCPVLLALRARLRTNDAGPVGELPYGHYPTHGRHPAAV
jgi:hypothetical protein